MVLLIADCIAACLLWLVLVHMLLCAESDALYATRIAIALLNNRTDVLPQHRLQITVADDQVKQQQQSNNNRATSDHQQGSMPATTIEKPAMAC